MRKTLVALGAFVLVALAPASAFAWGFAGHRLIMRRAIELLPPELKPFFERFKEEIVIRVTDLEKRYAGTVALSSKMSCWFMPTVTRATAPDFVFSTDPGAPMISR